MRSGERGEARSPPASLAAPAGVSETHICSTQHPYLWEPTQHLYLPPAKAGPVQEHSLQHFLSNGDKLESSQMPRNGGGVSAT